jgi:serine/threonine protein kinase
MLHGNPEKDPSAVKLGDFGLGLIVDNDAAYSTYVGTVSYMAPVRVIAWRRIVTQLTPWQEISRMQAQSIYWTEHCDIFSLGCWSQAYCIDGDIHADEATGTMYHLCALRAPFEYRMESETDSSPRIPHSFSDTLQKCVESCLAFKPIRRKGLLSLLQHAKSRVSFDSDDLLIQVKEDIAPKGPDQHSRSMPRQSITGNALTLSYTPFEVTSPGKGPPRTDLPTNAKPTDDTKTDITTESSVLNEFREFRRQRRESPRREGGTEKRTELDITTESSVPFKWWWQKKEEQKE